jgi:hypothetical protein
VVVMVAMPTQYWYRWLETCDALSISRNTESPSVGKQNTYNKDKISAKHECAAAFCTCRLWSLAARGATHPSPQLAAWNVGMCPDNIVAFVSVRVTVSVLPSVVTRTSPLLTEEADPKDRVSDDDVLVGGDCVVEAWHCSARAPTSPR